MADAKPQQAGRKSLLFAGDIGDEGTCRELVEAVVKQFGRIDILVNNAAFQGKSVESFEALTGERVERTFRTNILAMFNLTRLALPHLKSGSAIINTSSIQAYQPNPSILDLRLRQGGDRELHQGVGQQLIDRGIRVNSVAPGPVWTPMVAQSFPEERLEKFGKRNPMGRPAQTAELAPAYVFLASEESRFVNGEILGVTGGKPLM